MCTIERVKKKIVLQRFRMNEFEKTRWAARNRMRYPLADFYASHIAFYEGMRSNSKWSGFCDPCITLSAHFLIPSRV